MAIKHNDGFIDLVGYLCVELLSRSDIVKLKGTVSIFRVFGHTQINRSTYSRSRDSVWTDSVI